MQYYYTNNIVLVRSHGQSKVRMLEVHYNIVTQNNTYYNKSKTTYSHHMSWNNKYLDACPICKYIIPLLNQIHIHNSLTEPKSKHFVYWNGTRAIDRYRRGTRVNQ